MATTEPGERMVALAEGHVEEFAARAGRYDRENAFVRENFAAMRASGLLAATAPSRYGGLGVTSVHDLTVAVSRLARGCPATAIAANMHLGFATEVSRLHRESKSDTAAAAGGEWELLLRLLGRGRMVLSHAGTEPGGAGLSFPATEATRHGDGYLVNGYKAFATNAEIADAVLVFLRIPDGAGWYRMGTALVRRGAPGMEVVHNWDALGMRGSGSHDIRFTDCFVPASSVRVGGPVGEPGPELWLGLLPVNVPLVGAYLGIAEAAYASVIELARGSGRGPAGERLAERPATAFQVGEMAVGLAVARATLGRAAALVDACLARPAGEVAMAEVDAVMSAFQCAKLAVNRAAADVVDRAMTVTGGRAYRAGHLLARLYRDVRAGPFMQPYAPSEALEFIGRAALGLDPYPRPRSPLEPGGAGTTVESRGPGRS